MSERTWTPAQRNAIDYAGGDLLLSAAAGSGKTATLTERIVSLLTAPDSTAEISRMLCVTFTRAAAAELRTRIGSALRAAILRDGRNARLARQLCDLGRAQITTIHSFCLSVLRPRFAELSLPAGFTVAETAEMTALARQVMADVVSGFFDAGDADFLDLADTLAGARNEASLDDVLLKLAKTVTEHGASPADLSAMAETLASCTGFFSTPSGAGTRARVRRFAAHYRTYFADVCGEFAADDLFAQKYLPAAQGDFALSDALLTAVERGDYSACRAALLAYDAVGLGRVGAADQTPVSLYFKEMRDKFKKEAQRLRESAFTLTEEEIADVTRRTARIAGIAARVLGAYFEELAAKKRERGVVALSDLEPMTARILMGEDGCPTAAAREAAAAYDYIFIDEFQDTNRAQDAIFTAIAGTARRFMVGDIKQSIYRFRGAEPEVFAAYRKKFPALREDDPAPAAASLFMQENFRCDKTVVDFTNLVSRHMFRRGSIPFTEEDELKFAKATPAGYTPAPAEIVLIDKKAADLGTETEPQYTARRIAEFLARGRRADGAHITPGDIAILLRSPSTDGADFAGALEARGIPVRFGRTTSLYERAEVVYMLSILRAIDNPGRDIDLAAAMRGPVFGFTLADLVQIRRTCPAGSLWDAVRTAAGILPPDEAADPADASLAARCRAFAERLTDLRTDARGMKADALILRLCAETGIEEIAAADPELDAASAAANLRALYDAARRFENGAGGGLYPFLKMIEAAAEEGEGAAGDDGTPAVQIVSIHHSKGLEFPVCFIGCADKPRNMQDATASLLFDPAVGAVMRLPDPGGLVRCDTPLRRSVSASIADAAVEEDMRVLYVAMTRARERLIVTAAVSRPAEKLERIGSDPTVPYFTEETVFTASSYLTWMLNALSEARFRGEDTSSVTVSVLTERAEESAAEADAKSDTAAVLPPEEIAAAAQRIRENLDFAYPHGHLAAVPAKLTVSRLYPGILDGEEETPAIGGAAALPEMGERNAPPAFLSGKTEEEAAFAGTATHVFLQFADPDRLARDGVEAERDTLLARGFITAEMAAAVRIDELVRFTDSDLFARMRRARWIRREFRFNAALPAADFTGDPALADTLAADGTDVIVQGVIDALFIDENGRAVLVDYKTDRLTAEELADPARAAEKLIARHQDQLRYYRAVTAGMLGREIEECLIYSLPLGDTVAVP